MNKQYKAEKNTHIQGIFFLNKSYKLTSKMILLISQLYLPRLKKRHFQQFKVQISSL
jgi:hypothetical protein